MILAEIDHIRPATSADRPAIESIIHAAYSPYVPRIGRPPGPMLDDYAAQIDAGRVHVVDRDGAVSGLLVLIPLADTMLLANVAVSPAAQGQGFGRALLRFAEHTATAAGLRSITLYTNEAMIENIALYTRHGYVETHRATEHGLHRVYMAKPLP